MFLRASLPGTVKPAPAKLCAAFLCTLLKRLRFSPQNVEFGTKDYPLSLAALASSPKGTPLPRRETLRHSLKPSPWGRWLDAKRQDGRGSFPGSGLALSGAAAPALPKGEPLAWRQTFRCKCKPSGFARASPFGRGGCERSEQTERARTLPAVRLFPQETSAAAAVCLYDPSRENAKSGSPQAARLCSNYQ